MQSNSSQHRLIIVLGERLLNVTTKDKVDLAYYIRPLELRFHDGENFPALEVLCIALSREAGRVGLVVSPDKTKYSDTSANEDNSFRNHIR